MQSNPTEKAVQTTESAPPEIDDLHYSINLMWINSNQDCASEFVCSGARIEEQHTLSIQMKWASHMRNYIGVQLKKWLVAHPEAQVNFWFDSETTYPEAIEKTRSYLAQISEESPSTVHLRDIREIPFVQMNADLFAPGIPVYFRVDFLKLIICLHQMENEGMDSATYADLSIGDKVESVLSKPLLYGPDVLRNLQQYGMLLGSDGSKTENQFLQMLKTPELMISLKHAINCCLNISTSTLNRAIETTNRNFLTNFYYGPFTATMVHVHLYLLALKTQEPVKIRADVVYKGESTEWVDYDPIEHGYIMFGNCLKGNQLGSAYVFYKTGTVTSLRNIIKLPACLSLNPGIVEFDSFASSGKLGEALYHNAVRKDINPGHTGKSHTWVGPMPYPKAGGEFFYTFWPEQTTADEEKNDGATFGIRP